MSAPSYFIVPLPEGGARVMVAQPQQLATFASELHAKLFVSALTGDRPESSDLDTVEAPAPTQPEPAPPVADAETEDWDKVPDDWDTALARIGNGETVKDVAMDMLLAPSRLRGRWAAHVKKLKQAEPQEEDQNGPHDAALPVVPEAEVLPDTLPRRAEASSLAFTEAEDVQIATAQDQAALVKLADEMGRPVMALVRRKRAIDAQVAKEMSQ